MRMLCLVIFVVSAGCLPYYDNTDTRVTRTSQASGQPPQVVTTTYRNRSFGFGGPGSMPIGTYGGQGGMIYAGCSDLHPESCEQTVVAYVYQQPAPMIVSPSPRAVVPANAANRQAEEAAAANKKLSELLAKHQEALAILSGQARQLTLQLCRLIVDSPPKSITDPKERENLVEACRVVIRLHTKTPAAEDAGGKKEEK